MVIDDMLDHFENHKIQVAIFDGSNFIRENRNSMYHRLNGLGIHVINCLLY